MIDRSVLESVAARVRTEESATTLVFIFRPRTARAADGGTPFVLQRADMKRKVAGEFRKVLVQHLDALAGNEELQIAELDPFLSSDGNRVERQAVDQVPGLPEWLPALADPTQLELAKLDDEAFDSLWAYAVIAHLPKLRVAYIRKFLPSRVVRGGGLLGAVWKNGVLSKIDDPVFNFDVQADVLLVGDDALILQKTLFEQIFELGRRIYEPKAKEALEKIESLKLISDVKAFAAICLQDPKKQKKLADIAQNVSLDAITFEKLVEIRDHWEIDVLLDPATRQIVLDDPAKIWNILKLIDDDYLRSPMTGQLYEVQSKRRIQRRPSLRPARRK